MEEKKFFFNGLNELRAFAALFVILHHIELFKNRDQVGNLIELRYFTYFISSVGKNGVYLFFVLSGFLITFLLLKEKEKRNTILFRKFFLRRVFRIWPLYYLIVVVGFILIPYLASRFDIFKNTPYYFELVSNSENYSLKAILLYLFFLPNLALDYFNIRVAGCSQAWSVGVEEQFYIIWPLLVFIFARKKIIYVFSVLLLTLIFFHVFLEPFPIFRILKIFPFEFMAIGAIGGYLYCYHKDQIVIFTKFKFIYILLVIAIFGLMFLPIASFYVQSILLSFLFLGLILTTINDDNKYAFRNKYMSHIGKISYGVYMYHPFILFLVFPLANTYLSYKGGMLFYNLFVYVSVFALTILLSYFSYKYFESIFINIKDTKYKSL